MDQILEQLEVNHTFFIQFALFAVFFFLISAIYLKPFQKVLELRNRKLKDDVQGSAELLQSVENRLNDYEREMGHARSEALHHYEKKIAEVRTREESALNEYKDSLKKEYMKATQQLQEEKVKVEAELKTQVTQLAETLAQKALGGK